LTCYCKRRLIRVAGALLVLTSMTFKFACGSLLLTTVAMWCLR